jgi:hypothetical protein
MLTLSCSVDAAASGIDDLAWLAGCWQADDGEAGSVEQWMAPAGGTMLGMLRTVRDGKTVEHEFMQITTQPDGTLAFIAMPSGQARTTFVAKTHAPDEVVFENAAHDFPQRVVYRWSAQDRLNARIEGTRAGKSLVIDFPMRHVACAASSSRPPSMRRHDE